jgi:vacuolar-type H+-ATPase subunit H
MEILQLVDQLEQVLNRGWRMPLTSSLVINEEECLRLIDQMRISVPSAIKESERMISERDRIMAEARSRAETMLDQAEEEAMKLVSQHFVTQEAHREADRIVAAGRQDAMRMVQEAEDYALNVADGASLNVAGTLTNAANVTKGLGGSLTFSARQYFNTGTSAFTLTGGTTTLAGGDHTLFSGQGVTANTQSLAIGPAATLDLGGTAQLFGFFRAPNNNAYAGSGGVITSALTAKE